MFSSDLELELAYGVAALLGGTYFWFVFMRKRDRLEPEPIRSLLFVLLLGGGLSALVAWGGNEALVAVSGIHITQHNGSTSVLNVLSIYIFSALIEECSKYSAAYLLIRKNREVNEPVDGIIYAVAVGLGFSFFENILYFWMHGGTVIVFRVIFAVPLHMATAAIWGTYFSTTLAQKRPFDFFNAFPLLLVATAFHATWNSSAQLLGGLFIILAPFVLRFCFKRIESVVGGLEGQSPFLSGAVLGTPAPQPPTPPLSVQNESHQHSPNKGGSIPDRKHMFCSECGSQIAKETNFCGNCGAGVQRSATSERGNARAGKSNRSMTFGQSLTTCFAKYFDFSGRASRPEYWWFYLFTALLCWSAEYLVSSSDIPLLINLALLIPTVSAGARRLHDTNRSGWWQLIAFTVIGVIPLLFWLASKGDEQANKYGSCT